MQDAESYLLLTAVFQLQPVQAHGLQFRVCHVRRLSHTQGLLGEIAIDE
jgi:hypothetical protein